MLTVIDGDGLLEETVLAPDVLVPSALQCQPEARSAKSCQLDKWGLR